MIRSVWPSGESQAMNGVACPEDDQIPPEKTIEPSFPRS